MEEGTGLVSVLQKLAISRPRGRPSEAGLRVFGRGRMRVCRKWGLELNLQGPGWIISVV